MVCTTYLLIYKWVSCVVYAVALYAYCYISVHIYFYFTSTYLHMHVVYMGMCMLYRYNFYSKHKTIHHADEMQILFGLMKNTKSLRVLYCVQSLAVLSNHIKVCMYMYVYCVCYVLICTHIL